MTYSRNFWPILFSAVLLLFTHTACTQKEKQTPAQTESPSAAYKQVRIKEDFLTKRNEQDNVDSPAIWNHSESENWIISTAKETDVLLVNDAATGNIIKRVGQSGQKLGEFKRPNGVAVIDDLALVVERDNQRVQLFALPDFKPLELIGADNLKRPYGLTVFASAPNTYELYVTDNYETPDEKLPPANELGERVHHYQFSVENGKVTYKLAGVFGDTAGAGVLKTVESIYADPANNTLLVADEHDSEHDLKVYTLDGKFTGTIIGKGIFKQEPEGIALYAADDSTGYWIATDQDYKANTFHIFDRKTFAHLGAFLGEITANTDGVALSQYAFGPFKNGAFYAVHDDGNVAAFSWQTIADSLGLRTDAVKSYQK
ncbi:putative phytase precursor [Chloroherpeton thalassium ATCC 35110]|uniref:Putative phytase n=1 Tax=Chloroherpeton thalassium (strain ATCC 35110 / GB-78) TaxID=517418 RepID=B3QZ52_CHLT3|nr:phytase [Chloroherpeton thalassium]ACF13745.1 putative phytase precursor [Chloroherpeton thalassium ATCC 35110]